MRVVYHLVAALGIRVVFFLYEVYRLDAVIRQMDRVVVLAPLDFSLPEIGLGPADAVVALRIADRALMQVCGVRLSPFCRIVEVAGVIPHPILALVVKHGAVEVSRELVRSLGIVLAGGQHRLLPDRGLRQVIADVFSERQQVVVDGQQYRLALNRDTRGRKTE
ncbi:MAG: hypothetical protein DMG07_28635 [Acidobacteria bacterium]|nr:MAG: hypothetical protein DMG07_28635 [Acidobacteriota bacterium]